MLPKVFPDGMVGAKSEPHGEVMGMVSEVVAARGEPFGGIIWY